MTHGAVGILRDAWTPRRIRTWVLAALLTAWLPGIGVPFRDYLDFSAFYTAATFAFTPDVVRLEPVVLAQVANELPISPFLYTPAFALLYVPLTWLPYHIAGAINVAGMFVALVAAAFLGARLYGIDRRLALLGALAWGPAATSVLSGQNATLALLLILLAGYALARRRTANPPDAESRTARWAWPLVAAICASLLAYKPQFLAPVLGLAAVRWVPLALLLAATGVLLHYLLAVVVAGGNFAWPADWLATLSAYSDVDLQTLGWSAVSLTSLLARINLPPLIEGGPAGLQGLSFIGYAVGTATAVACVPSLRRLPVERALALACVLVLLVMPHAWIHNATLLLPALATLAADARRRSWPREDRWLVALVYAAGLAWPLGKIVGFTFMPLVVVLFVPLLLGRGPLKGFGTFD